jgi:hypothetical protein
VVRFCCAQVGAYAYKTYDVAIICKNRMPLVVCNARNVLLQRLEMITCTSPLCITPIVCVVQSF